MSNYEVDDDEEIGDLTEYAAIGFLAEAERFGVELRARAERLGTREAWEAWTCCDRALYDLSGVVGWIRSEKQKSPDAEAPGL